MTSWPSSRANRVLAALYRIGWTLGRQSGSHNTVSRPDWPNVVFAFQREAVLLLRRVGGGILTVRFTCRAKIIRIYKVGYYRNVP